MPFKIVRNDITRMKVDVIVNTANEGVTYGDGIDTAVYQGAGEEQLLAARREIGVMEEGDVAITPGFNLPARYIIHAVSPFYEGGDQGEAEKLRSCYSKSMELAIKYKCQSIAFPLISTGSYGYPKEEAMRIAVDEIHAFLLNHDMLVYLVVFDNVSANLGLNIYPDLEAYIDYNYVCDAREKEYGDRYYGSARKDSFGSPRIPSDEYGRIVERVNQIPIMADEMMSAPEPMECSIRQSMDLDTFYEEKDNALERRMEHLADTFQEYLLYLIAEKDMTNAEVYKRSIITKQTFSKIKKNPEYHPDKGTAMRLCVGCKLNLDETKDLLARAGYALSPCDKRDVIFSYFIENEVFDMIEIDIVLEEHGLPCFIE